MAAVLLQWQRVDRDYIVKVERTVEMGEELGSLGRLPAEMLAQPFRVDGKQHEIGLTGEIFGESSCHLATCRQMDEAVAGIVGRALKAPTSPCLLKRGAGADLVNKMHSVFLVPRSTT